MAGKMHDVFIANTTVKEVLLGHLYVWVQKPGHDLQMTFPPIVAPPSPSHVPSREFTRPITRLTVFPNPTWRPDRFEIQHGGRAANFASNTPCHLYTGACADVRRKGNLLAAVSAEPGVKQNNTCRKLPACLGSDMLLGTGSKFVIRRQTLAKGESVSATVVRFHVQSRVTNY
ncbi:hypothetical protein Bbelb_385310 [Branchiostoma belcheri]|nr:hypothetical protein Bbelb_385310 [Branchiostoma belcheri]